MHLVCLRRCVRSLMKTSKINSLQISRNTKHILSSFVSQYSRIIRCLAATVRFVPAQLKYEYFARTRQLNFLLCREYCSSITASETLFQQPCTGRRRNNEWPFHQRTKRLLRFWCERLVICLGTVICARVCGRNLCGKNARRFLVKWASRPQSLRSMWNFHPN